MNGNTNTIHRLEHHNKLPPQAPIPFTSQLDDMRTYLHTYLYMFLDMCMICLQCQVLNKHCGNFLSANLNIDL